MSSVKISPDSLPSTRTVPSNDSFPSNSLPRPSRVVISPWGWPLSLLLELGVVGGISYLLRVAARAGGRTPRKTKRKATPAPRVRQRRPRARPSLFHSRGSCSLDAVESQEAGFI